jgi:hypothetical protein
MDLDRVPSRTTKIQFVVLIVESYITQGIETNEAGIDIRAGKRVIDEVVIRRIFIRYCRTGYRCSGQDIMPGLSRL